jgi:hypothetical protein
MGFTLDKVVPWGRSYSEYVRMFNLSDGDLKQRILGCGDGPASFNATLTQKGGSVISIDPIYIFDTCQIKQRILETYDVVLSQLDKNKADYIWDTIPSVAELGRVRMSAMEEFLRDYEKGKKQQRYIGAELPNLPFKDAEFDIALCSHFLFLYSKQLSVEFHLYALQEMLRVANEVRIFPLLMLEGIVSLYVAEIIDVFMAQKLHVEIQKVGYQFQRGADEMLVIKKVL